jgi:hypothetical protein
LKPQVQPHISICVVWSDCGMCVECRISKCGILKLSI